MNIDLHPSAVENFNKKADELLNLITEFPPEPPQPKSFPSDIHIAASISDKDIIGEPEVSMADYPGNTVNRFFYIDKRKFGLSVESYKTKVSHFL